MSKMKLIYSWFSSSYTILNYTFHTSIECQYCIRVSEDIKSMMCFYIFNSSVFELIGQILKNAFYNELNNDEKQKACIVPLEQFNKLIHECRQ